MKIEIEFSSSYEATVTIDGRKLEYGYRHGLWDYHKGLKSGEEENTIGGMISAKLSSPLIDILQSWMPDDMPERSPEAWEKLPSRIADAVLEKMGA